MYTDDEIIEAFRSWKAYRKPTLTKIKPMTKRELTKLIRQNRWGGKSNWGHQRRG